MASPEIDQSLTETTPSEPLTSNPVTSSDSTPPNASAIVVLNAPAIEPTPPEVRVQISSTHLRTVLGK